MIHADVTTDVDAVGNAVTGIPGSVPRIRGYRPEALRHLNQGEAREVLRLDEQRVPGLDHHIPNVPDPQLAGAVWSILEREPGFRAISI